MLTHIYYIHMAHTIRQCRTLHMHYGLMYIKGLFNINNNVLTHSVWEHCVYMTHYTEHTIIMLVEHACYTCTHIYIIKDVSMVIAPHALTNSHTHTHMGISIR